MSIVPASAAPFEERMYWKAFETAMILSASSNNLCLGGRHMLTRSEDFEQDVLRGKMQGCAAPDVRTRTNKDSHEGLPKIHSLDTRANLSSEESHGTLWPCNRRSLSAAKAISAVPVPAQPSHPCSIQLRLIGEFRNPKSRIEKVNSKESKLE